ncbi:MAG TPA: hypothetical protein VJ843_02930 [Candidatus Saccharimonadales bacterium]|nr:hypothetical protein [Candidatus Saccharimonadales bacterium]
MEVLKTTFTSEDLEALDVGAELYEEESPVRAPISSYAKLDLRSLTEASLDADVTGLTAKVSTTGGSSGS